MIIILFTSCFVCPRVLQSSLFNFVGMILEASKLFSKMQEEGIKPGKVNMIFLTRYSSKNAQSLSIFYFLFMIILLIKLYLALKKLSYNLYVDGGQMLVMVICNSLVVHYHTSDIVQKGIFCISGII